MKICLLIAAGSGAPTTFEHGGPVVRIGRDPDCELSIPGDAGAKVSRQHARIHLGAGGATLTDLGSSNGTLLNDKQLKEPAPLRVGDRIQLGYTGATLTVRELDLAAPPVGKAARIPPVLWIGSGAAVALVVLLVVVFWPRHPRETETVENDGSPPPTQPAPTLPVDDIEALSRGVVHEAYAQPVDYQPKPGPVVAKTPPDLIDELPPNQKPDGENVEWLPGYWAADEEGTDYVWVSGFWRNAPPRRHWVPGDWQEVEGGWMWSPGFWADDETQEISYVEYPPEPFPDTAPGAAPAPTSVFVPGNWTWLEERWFWRPGYWVTPEPGWVWVMDRYVWTPSGRCIFVAGYWDWPLERRGLLFAPVRVHRRPKHGAFISDEVVRVDALLGALFVGPARRHYHFGDYAARKGFVEIAKYQPTPSSHDPLYDHYRQVFRGNPGWERDFRKNALSGSPLSPLAKAREETLARQAGLAAAKKRGVALAIKTQPVKPEERTGERARIQHGRQVAEQRRHYEGQMLAQGHPSAQGRPSAQATPYPRPVPLVVPRGPAVHRAPVAVPKPPPAPQRVARAPTHFAPPSPPKPPPRRQK